MSGRGGAAPPALLYRLPRPLRRQDHTQAPVGEDVVEVASRHDEIGVRDGALHRRPWVAELRMGVRLTPPSRSASADGDWSHTDHQVKVR